MDIAGFRRAWICEMYGGSRGDWSPQKIGDLAMGLDHGVLEFATPADPKPHPIPLGNLLVASPAGGTLTAEKLTVDFQQGGRSFCIIFTDLEGEMEPAGLLLTGFHLTLLEK